MGRNIRYFEMGSKMRFDFLPTIGGLDLSQSG
jgi:hypothetical protein